MDAKRWMVFIGIVVVVIGGMIYMSVQNRLDVSDIGKVGAAKIIGAEERNGDIADHILGKKDSKVVLVEYADYQCSGCATAAPKVKALAEKYKDSIAIVSRSFIIPGHTNSRAASAAAEAAALQGKYWAMHDLLFTRQSDWSGASVSERTDLFLGYAKDIGLDSNKFKEDMASDRVTKKIDFDVALARMQKVTGTPTFIIGEEQVNIQASDNALEDAVKQALKDAGVEVKEDTEE